MLLFCPVAAVGHPTPEVSLHGLRSRFEIFRSLYHGHVTPSKAVKFDLLASVLTVAPHRLQHVEVIELLSTVIAHLVEGEIMQSRTGVCIVSLMSSVLLFEGWNRSHFGERCRQ